MKNLIRKCQYCKKDIPVERHLSAKYCSHKCCSRRQNRKYYLADPKLYKDKRLKFNSDVSQRIYSRIKSRAKIKGLDFDLLPSDIVVPTHCPVLGFKLKEGAGRGHHRDSPSVDRIDNSKGYTKDNIQVISSQANIMKSSADSEQLLKFAEWIRGTYG